MNKNKHITRMDYPRCKGWWVRLYKEGKTYTSEFVADGRYGKRKGLIEARKIRDRLIRKHKHDPNGDRLVPWGQFDIVGISISRSAKGYYHWVASYRDFKQSFGIIKNGYQGGFNLAMRALRKAQKKTCHWQKAPTPTDAKLKKWLKDRKLL